MALEGTMVLYKSSGDGPFGSVLVPRNAAWLGAKLALGASSWSLIANDKDYLDSPFEADQYVYCGLEKIKCGATPQTDITRAQSGTDAANHPKLGLVMPDPATLPASSLILDITVEAGDNGKEVTAIRCVGMPGPGTFIIDINDTVIDTPITSLDHQETFWPWTGSTLTTGDTIKVNVINYYPESLFRASVIR